MSADSQTLFDTVFGVEGRMTLQAAQEVAKRMNKPGQKATFDIVGPKGRKACYWIDPWLGFFEMEGLEGFSRVSDTVFIQGFWVENVDFAETTDSAKS